MLAATSLEREQNLAPFHVALRILSNDRDLPAKLSAHLKAVIAQAIRIAADPRTIDSDTLPEAIQLALELQQSQELRRAVEDGEGGRISPDTARDILAAERRFATRR